MEKTKRAKEKEKHQFKQATQNQRFAKLSASALGLSFGIIGALLTVLIVIYVNATDEFSNSSLSILSSVEGSLFAIINSFIELALLGVIIAWLYNRFAK